MAAMKTDAAKRDVELARHDTRLLLSVAAVVALGITVLGLILT